VTGWWDGLSKLQKRAQESQKVQRQAFKEIAALQDANSLWFMDESAVVHPSILTNTLEVSYVAL
jgi:hypothetical protein